MPRGSRGHGSSARVVEIHALAVRSRAFVARSIRDIDSVIAAHPMTGFRTALLLLIPALIILVLDHQMRRR